MSPTQGLTYYVLNEEVIRKRLARYNIPLRCCICSGTLCIGDSIVRKHRKLYHKTCWENAYFDIPDSILEPEDIQYIETGNVPVTSFVPITTSTISTNTIPTNTITFHVRGSTHGDLNQKHC
jgi:hypothetical protein